MARSSAFLYAAVLALFLWAPGSASAKGLLSRSAIPLSVDKHEQLQADPHVIRWRVAQWDANAVFDANATSASRRAHQDAPAPETPAPLVLNLFDDVAVKAHVRSAKMLESGSRFLFGALEDGGHFSLLRHRSGVVRGEVHSASDGYMLRSDGATDRVLVMQKDMSISCGHRHGTRLDSRPTESLDIHWRRDREAAPAQQSKTIDVLFTHTQLVEDRLGGPEGIRADIEHAVELTNQALENSGLPHRRISIAGIENIKSIPAVDDPGAVGDQRDDQAWEEHDALIDSLYDEHDADTRHNLTLQADWTTPRIFSGGSSGGYTNDYYHQSTCADAPNPALCYYNVRREEWRDGGRSESLAGAGVQWGLFAHEWGHDLTLRHDRESGTNWEGRRNVVSANYALRDLRPMGFGHTNSHFPNVCQYTIMSYATACGLSSNPYHQLPSFSNPDLLYPRPPGLPESFPDVPRGVPGDERTDDLDGPVDATRVIDEVWDIVASLSEPPLEVLAGACNEGDMATDVLSSRLPTRVAVTFASGDQTYWLPVSGPPACLDDVSLKADSSNVAFDVDTSDVLGGGHRLSVVATEPHSGACLSTKRAVVTAELWDAVEEFPPEVIRQRVPGVSPGYLHVEQRPTHSFCKGAPARHHLRGLGDFDGDGRSDALLRHADGRWLYQPIDERNVRSVTANLNNNPAVSVAGIGDFNGDGKDDVLMRRANGSWRNYLMDGPRSIAGGGGVALPSDEAWQVEGIGDFNGDGKDDVLLRHADGRWQYHPMDGRMVLEGGEPYGLEYEHPRSKRFAYGWVAGVGDFNGDRRDDVLYRRMDGTWHYYPFYGGIGGRTGLYAGHGEVLLSEDPAWAVAGVADFNGDGKADVLLRHEDGRWHYYAMDGRAVVEETVPALPADPLVWLAGVGDTDGDGKADVLTRRAHGVWRVYRMDGGRVAGESEVGLASESGWGVLTGGAVAPVETTAPLSTQPLALGADAALDLSAHFADDQTLSYEVHSTDSDVVRASVTGDLLTLMPVTSGRATVTVTAHDPDGNTAVQSFAVVVSEDGQDIGATPQAAGEGRRFRDCAECPEMAVAPSGWFMMGAPADEAGSSADERPRHRVDFAAPFSIGVYEVTKEQWSACVDANGCVPTPHEQFRGGWLEDRWRWFGGSRGLFDERPVVKVSWHDVVSFVDWLSMHTGQAYRLPSEAEWEYAARAGTKTPYHFGETLTGQANYASIDVDRSLGVGRFRPDRAPVGWFAPNVWGLHDVHGNVEEWTQDCWNANYVGAPTDGGAWETGDCERRLVRGGHWTDEDPLALRSAKRRARPADARRVLTGFRVARSLSPIEAVATQIPAQTLALGTDATVDLVAHFGNDQTLSYEVRSSDAEVVRASVSGGALTLTPVATGDATVTVTARDENGNTATQTVPVEVWLRDCADCPAMVVVPAGTFTMGAPESEPRSNDDERPQRTVSVPAFAAGIFEVTFAEWDACVTDGGCDGYQPDDEGWGRGQRPVVNVSWQHAQRYVEWLSLRSGYRYRLLSESEWEYAARAGTETPFHTGDDITPQQANFNGTQTTPVGSFAPNAFGLRDMHGNVGEWVQDCYGSYESAPVDGSAVDEEDCAARVVRGGSWRFSYAADTRSAFRSDYRPVVRGDSIGFRVARTH